MTGRGRCPDCGGASPRSSRCWDCVNAQIARIEEARSIAGERVATRGKLRRGTARRFRIQSTFCGNQLSRGSCETREEAFFEARWILATLPKTSRVAVEEIVLYEIRREGSSTVAGEPQGFAGFRAVPEGIA